MHTLRGRLILSHTLPILVVVPLIALVGYVILSTQGRLTKIELTLDQEVQRLTEQALYLTGATAAQDNIWSDPAVTQDFVTNVDVQVTTIALLDTQGKILAATVPSDTVRLLGLLGQERLTAILEGQTNIHLQYLDTGGVETAVLLAPVLGANQQLRGILLLGQTLSAIQRGFERIYWLLLLMVGGLLILGVMLGSYLALQLETSLRRVTASLHGIATGHSPDSLPDQQIAEIDMLYQAVNTLAQRLHTLEEARKRLLANLVHELGRPLGSLRSAVHALRQGAVEDEELCNDLLAGMEYQIEHMEPLLDDLTLLHGQVLGPLELSRQPVAFSAWLRQRMTLWRELARQKNIGWRADVPLDLPQIEIDVDQMGRALGNLFSNAVKFTPAGGSILVEAGVNMEGHPDTHGLAWIGVNDSGPGVPAQEQEQIFEPFQRGVADHRFPQGMGLGLAIARDVARAHGGDITVESTPESGSRFTLTFPVSSEANTVISSHM